MDTENTRDRVLSLFMQHRAKQQETFDEDHFLDYFLSNPSGARGRIGSTFSGLRRYNRFLQAVELEFAVCFGTKDFEKNYSLSRFVERIGALQAAPRSSQAALRAKAKGRSGCGAMLVIDSVLLSLIVAAWPHWWLACPLFFIFFVVTAWFMDVILGEWWHIRKLRRLLDTQVS